MEGHFVDMLLQSLIYLYLFIFYCRGNVNVGSHTSEHQLEPINRNSTFFVDGDYLGLSGGSTSAGYNYLDTNFLPSAS